jgi:inosine-uridine nucleoside N-ribohydrolase
VKVHLDTDFAGDTDDACALALLLGWPGVEITGLTTVAEPDGPRAGYVDRFLELAGRTGIPVACGAGRSLTTGAEMGGLPDHDAFWGGEPVTPHASRDGDALALLHASIELGATVIGIGPYTNLAPAAAALASVPVVLMGGWLDAFGGGAPHWGAHIDWNVQCDTGAMEAVFEHATDLTLVTIAATVHTHIRASDLDRLRASGPIGMLLARQARAHAADQSVRSLFHTYDALPPDLLNFQHDPLACAVALGWEGAPRDRFALRPRVVEGVLHFDEDATGREVDVVQSVDGEAFSDAWLDAVARIHA